jgi:predicted HTH domain antitoxin
MARSTINMTVVSFQLPDSIEQELRRALGDVNAAAKEAALVELYRQGQLSHGKLAESLEMSRYETDALLKRHNVTEDLLTRQEFDEQLSGLRKSLGQ